MMRHSTSISPIRNARKILRKQLEHPSVRGGFTLVELLVAMTIATVIFAVAWKFLDHTATASREITSSSETIEDARIALNEVVQTLEGAASYASPDSNKDPWVKPSRRSVGRISGIYPYANSENRIIWNDGSGSGPPTIVDPSSPILQNNPAAVFDGLVVLGAFSYPLSFETKVTSRNGNELRVPDTPRGLFRLNNIHPFIVKTGASSSANTIPNQELWRSRLIRILDAEGYKQFSGVREVSNDTITLTTPLSPKGANVPYGIDFALNAGDRTYNTSALDLYWFRVRLDPNPSHPNNLQLVRDRLCAGPAIQAYGNSPTSFNPQQFLPDVVGNCGPRETVVLANNIATFDTWIDCGNSTSSPFIGTVTKAPAVNLARPSNWNIASGNCYSNTQSTPLNEARAAHIRIATFTTTERKSLTNVNNYFIDPPGILVAFDANPQYAGASPVTTLQTDVFMRNFLYW